MDVKKVTSILVIAVFTIFIACENQGDKGIAKTQKIEGLYVFIKSEPTAPYNTIGTIKSKDVFERAIEVGVGEEKAGTVLKNIIKSALEEIPFEKKLSLMASEAKDKYPNAEGIIFTSNLNNCSVIRFVDE
ncbi:MAG: hypothetical protein IIA45_06580 [Bacteroidetes bacterium]|nr:hypothetical protein [Bacteroidota bacterium]